MIPILPEIVLLITAFYIVAVELISPVSVTSTVRITLLGIGVALYLHSGHFFCREGRVCLLSVFGGRLQVGGVGDLWLKILFLFSAAGTVAIVGQRRLVPLSQKPTRALPEFCATLLFSVVGMMVMVSATDLLTMYVSLELATIPQILLIAWGRTEESSEAGLKYVTLGALATGFLLFGIGFIYGASNGEFELEKLIGAVLSAQNNYSGYLFSVGVLLVLTGVFLKIGCAPFHMWAPDVYDGAPLPVTAFISVASKALGIGFIVQMLRYSWTFSYSNLAAWNVIFVVLSAVTMTVGNLGAIGQRRFARFIAYSGISQIGYMLLAFIDYGPQNLAILLFYLFTYLASNLAIFSVFAISDGRQTKDGTLGNLVGLSLSNPVLALVMMLSLFSLAGIPPLAGFSGKFLLFSLVARSGYYWLVVLAAVNSTVSLYYYLGVVRQMYIVGDDNYSKAKGGGYLLYGMMTIYILSILTFGIFPGIYKHMLP